MHKLGITPDDARLLHTILQEDWRRTYGAEYGYMHVKDLFNKLFQLSLYETDDPIPSSLTKKQSEILINAIEIHYSALSEKLIEVVTIDG